ncbi:MAG: hypothetical protein ABWY06_23675 [Pseudomonas sp.]|uniref:hypothetical protein n=1 Tax=Pseudomonas sp. TaxID=306 RepID=UPI0033928F0F
MASVFLLALLSIVGDQAAMEAQMKNLAEAQSPNHSAAIELLEHELDAQSHSAKPDQARASGLLDMAEATGVIDTVDLRYWRLKVSVVCDMRRQRLRYGMGVYRPQNEGRSARPLTLGWPFA